MLTTIVVVAVLAAVFLLLPWFAQRMQQMAGDSSSGSNAFGVLEEVFHPEAHRAQVVREQADEVRSQAPAPDDPPEDEGRNPSP